MRIKLIIPIILMGVSLWGTNVDSLKQLTTSEKDTSQFYGYLHISEHYLRTEMDSSIFYLNKARKLLPSLKKHYSPDIYKQSHAEYLRQAAIKYHFINRFDSAKIYYEKALLTFKETDNFNRQEQILNNLGVLHQRKGDYATALDYYFHLLRLCDKSGNKKEKSRAYTNIGVVNVNLGEYEEALKYYNQALPIKKELGLKKSTALLYNNIGVVYYHTGNYKKVLEYFKRSLNIYRQMEDLRGQAKPYFNIAEIYNLQAKYKEALYFYKKCYEIEKKLGEKAEQASTLSTIGLVYSNLNQFKDAIRVQKKAIDILSKLEAKPKLSQVKHELSLSYEAMGDFKNALKWFKAHKKLKDSLVSLKKNKQIEEIKETYESEQKDQKIALLKEQNKNVKIANEKQEQQVANRQRIAIMSLLVAVLGLFGLVMIYRLYKQKIRANKLLESKNEAISYKNEEVKEILARLQKALKSREYFFRNTTHEFRTPLSIIAGFTNLLEKEQFQDKLHEYVNHIKAASGQVLRLSNNVMIVSRISSGDLNFENESVSIQDVCNHTMSAFKFSAYQRNLELNYSIDNNCPDIIEIDPYRFYQILSNLIDNAIAHTLPKGKVSFNFLCENKGELTLKVIDDGSGIDDQCQKELFERFDQIKRDVYTPGDKYGIGLNVVMKLVDLMQGTFFVDSNIGEGTVIKITIPADLAQKVSFIFQSKNNSAPALLPNSINLLIAEDDEVSVKLLADIIAAYNPNIQTEVARNGKEALNLLTEKPFDILILDLNMPVMDGFELTKILRNTKDHINQHIPILAISAQGHHNVSKESFKAGMNGFLEKPFDTSRLIYEIEQLIDSDKLASYSSISHENEYSAEGAELTFKQEDKNTINSLLDKLNHSIRGKLWDDIVQQCSELRFAYSHLIGKDIMKSVNAIERECVTTRNLDRINQNYVNVRNWWKNNQF